ncbi:MAG: hypothetical protein ACRD2S_00190 [Terriglobales bacterium]
MHVSLTRAAEILVRHVNFEGVSYWTGHFIELDSNAVLPRAPLERFPQRMSGVRLSAEVG